ncbi:MAG: hypothetical protein AABZ08_08380 [Planctomycetota bacterium]
MTRRLQRISCLVVTTLLAVGCDGGKSFSEARKAEERGDPHVAYDQYCKAATDSRGGATASGLARVRGGASAYWESQALLEMDAGNYGESWRMLMKALEIQPDSTTTAKMIRQLELQHGEAIAEARTEWMQRGSVALASALRPRRRATVEPAPIPTSDDKQSVVESKVALAPPPKKESGSSESDAGATRQAEPVVIPVPGGKRDEPASTAVESPQDTAVQLTPAPVEPIPEEKPIVRPTTQSPEREARPVPKKPSRPAIRREPVRESGRSEFLVMQSLSLKDRSLSRGMTGMEGISILLKDTDDDEADFDLFSGKERIKKIRDLKLGRSQVFAGQSGTLYRLTLLGIHHKSRTVRVGIRPA